MMRLRYYKYDLTRRRIMRFIISNAMKIENLSTHLCSLKVSSRFSEESSPKYEETMELSPKIPTTTGEFDVFRFMFWGNMVGPQKQAAIVWSLHEKRIFYLYPYSTIYKRAMGSEA